MSVKEVSKGIIVKQDDQGLRPLPPDGSIKEAMLAVEVQAKLNVNNNIVSITSAESPFTVAVTDRIILVDASGGSVTINLPTAVSFSGISLTIKRTDSTFANLVTIDGSGAETIDGDLTRDMHTNGEVYRLVSDGTSWTALDHKTDTDWVAFTMTIDASTTAPTKGTVVTDLARWRRQGDSLKVRYSYQQSAGGADGTGDYLFLLPNSFAIDTTKQPVSSTGEIGNVGSALAGPSSGPDNEGVSVAYDSTHIAVQTGNQMDSTEFMSSTNFPLGSASNVSFSAEVPISGWRA